MTLIDMVNRQRDALEREAEGVNENLIYARGRRDSFECLEDLRLFNPIDGTQVDELREYKIECDSRIDRLSLNYNYLRGQVDLLGRILKEYNEQ